MDRLMDLSIIIINWNSANYLRECLRSIHLHTQDISFEIIVVDNASYDGCAEMLAREFANVVFIQSEENLGFSRGNNLAVKHSSGETLLFLNPDTEVKGPALAVLLKSIQTLRKAVAVGARILNADGTVQTSCLLPFPTIANEILDADLLRKLAPTARIWGMKPLFAQDSVPKSVEGISGACLMTRRDVFQTVGGFSEDYFMYYEDMDYCLKVRNAGWSNYFIPDAVVIHFGGKSSGGDNNKFSVTMMAESAWKFFRKHRGLHYAELFRISLAAKAIFRFFLLVFARMVISSEPRRRGVKGSLGKWIYVLRWCLRARPGL